MSRVVVVGAGAAGLAAAARLGRLRHDVVVVEQDAAIGGRWRATEVGTDRGRFRFDAQPADLRLPAALRDLFLKTGRKPENAVDLRTTEQVEEHVFAEGARVVVPNTGRADAVAAVADALGAGAGDEWERHLDAAERLWDHARSPLLESPPARGPVRTLRLSPRRTLHRSARRLRDRRLRAIADHHGVLAGWPAYAAPATAAVLPYLEQAFRVWTSATGPTAVAEAIHDRALAAGAVVVAGTRAERVTTAGSRVDGVLLADGRRLPAEVVVSDVGDPAGRESLLPSGHGLPAARPADHVEVLLGLRERTVTAPTRRVLHGADGGPALTVWVDPDAAPAGHEAMVVSLPPGAAATTADDVLDRLARDGFDVRDRVVVRETRTVRGAVPVPTWFARPGPATGVGGLFAVGRSAAFGRDLSFVVMSAAAVAEQVGRA